MIRRLRLLSVLALPVLNACASASLPPPSPAELQRLEARALAEPSSDEAVIQLAAAYQRSGQSGRARELLEAAVAEDPASLELALMLASVREELEDFAGARELYRAYIESGPSARLRDRLRRRLALLERREMLAQVRRLVHDETTLAELEPERGTIAVYPFLYSGADPELQPLSRALAELLATDLSRTNRLRVLERARVQMLLDELRLGQDGYVAASSAARSGRLLRAEHVVQGRLGDAREGLALAAAVMEVEAARETGTVEERDALQRLFEAERRLALGIYRALGVQLTPAEEELVGQAPTQNLQALLAFGRALDAEDRGDFRAAAAHYRQATRLDPGFQLANQREQRAMDMERAERVSAVALAQTFAPDPTALDASSLDAFAIPDPSGRDAAAEAFRQEGLATPTILRIILSRPE